jgi:hypothetical protein
LGTSGRGPTRLISPRTTFHNSGSSSIFAFRMIRPTAVTLWSPLLVTWAPRPSCSRIERNLISLKGLPSRPARTCRKRIGPLEPTRTAIAHTRSSGERTRRPTKAKVMSKKRRINCRSNAECGIRRPATCEEGRAGCSLALRETGLPVRVL